MNVPPEIIDKVLTVLIRNVGNMRHCPCCSDSFVPSDMEAKDSFEAFKLLKSCKVDKPMSAKDKAITWLKKLKKGQCEEDVVDSIIEAVKEDLATPGKEFDHLWEDKVERPFPRVLCTCQPDGPMCQWCHLLKANGSTPKPCSNCGTEKVGRLILVDQLGPGAKCLECGKLVPYPQNPEAEPEMKPSLIQGYTAKQWQEIKKGGYLCEFSLVPFDTPGHVRIGTLHNFSMDYFDQKEHSGVDSWSFCRPAKIKGVMRPVFVEPSAPEAWCSFFGDHSHVGDERWCVREHTGHFPTATRYIEL